MAGEEIQWTLQKAISVTTWVHPPPSESSGTGGIFFRMGSALGGGDGVRDCSQGQSIALL